jgi:hypothetical protein
VSGLATAVLLAAAMAAAWTVGDGAPGLLYLLVYIAIVAPGLPLGFALFGRDHPAGWIAGAGIGYALAVIAFWVVIAGGRASPPAFVVAIALMGLITWTVTRGRPAVLVPPPGSPAVTTSMAAVLLLTLALAAPPLAAVGAHDEAGNKRYRAYFTADFVWHAAITAELTHFTLPARNPYLTPQPIHYYWGYFLVPAVAAQAGPSPLRDVERCLRLNALVTGVLLVASIFLAAFVAVGHAIAAAGATALALCAASLEGIYGLWRLWSRQQSLWNVRGMNIDALTAWYLQGHRIDGLPRCLWYVPQHSMSYLLGLIALSEVALAGSRAPLAAVVIAGLALGGSTLFNPFVGGMFALVWGAAVVVDAVRHRTGLARLVSRNAVAAVPVVLAVGWTVANRMVSGAGGALEFGLGDTSRQAPLVTLLLSFGPVLVAAVAGMIVSAGPRQSIVPASLLAAVSIVLMYFVRLNVDHEWVPFRAGQMLIIATAVLAARWFAAPRPLAKQRIVVCAGLLLFLAGAPTTAIDAYNARDVSNLAAGPGFRWTLLLSPDQQQAFDWIRRQTPRNAVVQMEPIVRQRDAWSLIPSFAQRRMAAGLPISLLRTPEYLARSEQVETLYSCRDPREAVQIAHGLRIGYLYVDATDRSEYPNTAKFDVSPQFFVPVFRQGDVGVYAVR